MVVPVAQIKEQFVKVCIYGRNRIGKTTFACQFPKPLLLVGMEPDETGGSASVQKEEGVYFIQITPKPMMVPTKLGNGAVELRQEKVWGSRKALMLADELHRKNPYKTVVVDSCTAYQDLILQELMGLDAVPEMLSWGQVPEGVYQTRSEKTREALRPFLDLKCHVVITAKEKDHRPPEGRSNKLVRPMQLESFFAPSLGGATVDWLQDACGYIGHLYQDMQTKIVKNTMKIGDTVKTTEEEVQTGKIVRRLRTLYHPNFAAGFRSATPNAVPEWIEAESPKEMYEAMMQVIAGNKVKQGKYS